MGGPSREMYEKRGGSGDDGEIPLGKNVPLMKRQDY